MSSQPTPPKKPAKGKYENNPFNIGIEGVRLFFNKATGMAILLTVLSVLGVSSNFTSRTEQEAQQKSAEEMGAQLAAITPEQWAVIGVLTLLVTTAIILISALISGMSSYTAVHTAKGKTVSIRKAFSGTLEHIWSYTWLQVLIGIKVLLWSLLFIIPGIVMAVRYSFASLTFFDEDKKLRGNAAIKDSIELTRGGWLTTFASMVVLSVVSLGTLSELVGASSRAVLYRQFRTLQKAKTDKPRAHWLSYVTLIIPIVLVTMGLLALLAVAAFVVFDAPTAP